MVKKFSIALVLLITVASANADVLHGNSLKSKKMTPMLTSEPSKAVNVAHPPTSITPTSSQNHQSLQPISGRYFVALSEQSKTFFSQTENNTDSKKLEHGANVSAVPVPAALPLMATVLGIYGIARRRRTFK